MLKFHPLKVAGRRDIAEDAVSLTLEVPPALAGDYRFAAGQHLAVRAVIDGQEERRTYSIVNAEGEGPLTLGIRVQPGGRMSHYLAEKVAPGDLLEVMTPNGSFHPQPPPGRARSCVAFAAGSGITPVLSIARTVLAREPDSRFWLYYGNTSIARTMFLDEVMALKDRYLTRFVVRFVMSREPQDIELFNGRIDADKVAAFAGREFDPAAVDEYFICGPGTMVEDVQRALAGLGVTGQVHVEHFVPAAGEPAAAAQPAGTAPAARAGEVSVAIVMDGRRRSFEMGRGELVLDAAERAGLDLPFSCRAGVCSTCRAKLVGGSAKMDHNVALEDWEVEAGYILCCQARPASEALEISYDE